MYIDRVMLDIGLKVQKFKSNEFLKKKIQWFKTQITRDFLSIKYDLSSRVAFSMASRGTE